MAWLQAVLQAGPPNRSFRPDDGTIDTARWYAREGARLGATMLDELHQTERIQTRCAFCTETSDGTFRDGRAWFAEHRASVMRPPLSPRCTRRSDMSTPLQVEVRLQTGFR